MLGYLSADIICSEKRTVLRERSSRKTVSYEEQIMSKDKYSSIFSSQMEAIVFINVPLGPVIKCLIFSPQMETIVFIMASNLFRNARIFENWGIFKNWFMLSVRISSYGCTREVWRARKKRKSCSRRSREQL